MGAGKKKYQKQSIPFYPTNNVPGTRSRWYSVASRVSRCARLYGAPCCIFKGKAQGWNIKSAGKQRSPEKEATRAPMGRGKEGGRDGGREEPCCVAAQELIKQREEQRHAVCRRVWPKEKARDRAYFARL